MLKVTNRLLLFLILLAPATLWSQGLTIRGMVSLQGPKSDQEVLIQLKNKTTQSYIVRDSGFVFKNIWPGLVQIQMVCLGYKPKSFTFTIAQDTTLFVSMEEDVVQVGEVVVEGKAQNDFGMTRLNSIEGTTINESKKSEVILLKDIIANTSANNARQVFSKVPGLNIWENDEGGLQLGIGARGLNPNRTSNFNVRQNGYDISADPLGYPETYYTPPLEAVEKIEIVRGAASLPYGTQFGGLINFVMKKGNTTKPLEAVARQTVGSYGFYNSFLSLGGTKGRWQYYSYYQYKRTDGWRENSGFNVHNAYLSLQYKLSEKADLHLDYTFLNNIAQQPGGLTDAEFLVNPRVSKRDRNWFRVNWNVASLQFNYKWNTHWRFNSKLFGNFSDRTAIGNLDRIDRADVGLERRMIFDAFKNIGNESRLLHTYRLGKQTSAFLVGVRLFHGYTESKQGLGNNSDRPIFTFLNPDNLENSSYTFKNYNAALFTENVFFLSKKWSITPGIRFEWIQTNADGYYKQQVRDLSQNLIAESITPESRTSTRSFFLFGLGTSYRPNEHVECYGNISQNYRSVTFSDIRIVNPSFRIDPNIRDEKGYTADIGLRGTYKNWLSYDGSVFWLAYQDRISDKPIAGEAPTFLPLLMRTNVGESYTLGYEAYIESNFAQLFMPSIKDVKVAVFVNGAYNYARYRNKEDLSVDGKIVENVPAYTFKTGLTLGYKKIQLAYQYMYVAAQFTDATNTRFYDSAVWGIIPAYQVMDVSAKYALGKFSVETGVNNLTNERYFTRRAEGYPGPGILPALAIRFYLTLAVKL